MSLLSFEDYIDKYSKVEEHEWTVLYENIKSSKNNIQQDIFGFCALVENDESKTSKYLSDFEWGFDTGSFGHTFYQQTSTNIGGQFMDQIDFISGDQKDEYSYLVAYRSFNQKYTPQVEINPKLIWYGNLVKVGNDYLDPVTDETVIKVNDIKIQVLTKYLKDFLCSYNKICVIVFDHRRFGLVEDKFDPQQKSIRSKSSFILFTLSKYKYKDYNAYSNIIGKTIIRPYTKCRHSSLKYFEEKQFLDFIIGTDEETGEDILFTCDENKLANYFGANPDAPHFLTPVYFNKIVLNKYKTDTKNYKISDGNVTFLDEWMIPFTVNNDNKVVVWLGDLGRIPYEEQLYWKRENISPKGGMEKNFYDQQINNIFVDKILPEKWLFTLINQTNELAADRFGEVIFNNLSEADSSILSAFITPVSNNIDEFKEFLIQFCKIIAESINKKIIEKYVDKRKLVNENGDSLGSIAQLSVFFNEVDLMSGEKLIEAIKLIYNSRNKLAGHTASIKEYNKLFKRDKDYEPNWIIDAKNLLNSVNDALNEIMEEL